MRQIEIRGKMRGGVGGGKEGKRGDGDGGGGGSCGGGDPTLTVVQTQAPDACNGKRTERGGWRYMLVSSLMLNVLSLVCNCSDTTQVATDRQTDGWMEGWMGGSGCEASLIRIGECAATAAAR